MNLETYFYNIIKFAMVGASDMQYDVQKNVEEIMNEKDSNINYFETYSDKNYKTEDLKIEKELNNKMKQKFTHTNQPSIIAELTAFLDESILTKKMKIMNKL